jgi:hypothetical protein
MNTKQRVLYAGMWLFAFTHNIIGFYDNAITFSKFSLGHKYFGFYIGLMVSRVGVAILLIHIFFRFVIPKKT